MKIVRDLPQAPVTSAGQQDPGRPGDRGSGMAAGLSHADPLVRALVETTRTAGSLALGFFRSGEKTNATISYKAGGSPVTEADEAVNRYLEQELRKLLPAAAWLSEESVDTFERLAQDLVLVIDPIDGTKAFAAGLPAWAVAVALVFRSRPIVGIIHAPALSQTYVAVHNCGARLNDSEIHVSALTKLRAGATVAGPQRLAQNLLNAGLSFDLLPKIPSLALRIAHVAAGTLDAALVSENSHDWDIAAADLILDEAGGLLTSLDGDAPTYNRRDTRHGILVAAPLPIVAQIHAAVSRPPAAGT
ncbi:MAG: 3'(2'),5'-bisphosphate nucleotidase CysQ [Beijerinckiaceae bacterium]